MATEKTKSRMISELRAEFLREQGRDKARWVSNHLNKLNKAEVSEQYKRLKGKVHTFRK